MSSIIYLNGEYLPGHQAKVSIFDRGFLFGDSVYEVIPFYNRVGFRLQEHLLRLRNSLVSVGIRSELDWEPICQELIERNGGGNQMVYLQVTRGADTRRTHQYGPELQPTLLALCQPLPPLFEGGLDQVQGIQAITTDDIRWHRCDIKATTLLGNIMSLHRAEEAGAQEALMVREGHLTEGSSCNIFVIEQGCIFTPRMDDSILGGTTRYVLLMLAKENGIPCFEDDIAQERLSDADEVWITSSTRGVIPVLNVDGHAVGRGEKGPLWYRMAQLFLDFEQRVVNADQSPD
jgi:D-alanine transaminase